MKRFLAFLLALLFGIVPSKQGADELFLTYSRVTVEESRAESETETADGGYLRAVWLSQFDMQPLYRDGNKQRDERSFIELMHMMMHTLTNDGFDTVFLQLRPNGDSMYKSEVFPLSKYVAGVYGGDISYDAVQIVLDIAREYGISVHGWINPLRLVTIEEMEMIPTGYAVRDWFDADNGYVKEFDGRLYLDPSYPEVRSLIASGVREILETYGLDGIHMDDYFYPTTDKLFDAKEFAASSFDDVGDFRRNNINTLVSLLYDTAHAYDAVFGISPAGNLDSLADGYFADAKLWCAEEGYIDYILPQLYFGFANKYCPFDVMVDRWADTVTCDSVSLYIGLSAAKAVLGSQGELDAFAGTDEGKREWIEHEDILARSLKVIYDDARVGGYCFFSYTYLYDLFTGKVAEGFEEEYGKLQALLANDVTP